MQKLYAIILLILIILLIYWLMKKTNSINNPELFTLLNEIKNPKINNFDNDIDNDIDSPVNTVIHEKSNHNIIPSNYANTLYADIIFNEEDKPNIPQPFNYYFN